MTELQGKMRRTTHIQEDTDNEDGSVGAAQAMRALKH
jgi:hypothetical protein